MQPSHDHTVFVRYEELLRKIDAFAAALTAKYRADLACLPGCSACCTEGLSVLPVEFYRLRKALQETPPARAALSLPERFAGCCLLRNDRCLLYACRPVICRTHGLPLLITAAGSMRRDCCPRNFTAGLLETLPDSDLLHLERLNSMLFAVNSLFARAHQLDPQARMPLARLADDTGVSRPE